MAQISETKTVFDDVTNDVGPLGDPLVHLAHDHATQRALADLLEGVADALPDGVDRRAAALGAHSLRMLAARRWPPEEQALFPLIESRLPEGAPARRAVAIARREHCATAGRAIELADELEALADGGRACNPEALGFMLRAFFDGLRRHLDWMDATMMPAARDEPASPRDSVPLDRDPLFCDLVRSGRAG